MNKGFTRITDEASYEKSISQLDKFQKLAVNSDAEKLVIKAGAGSGKALRNGTKVLTSSGFINIENLTMQSLVAGSDGKFHKVLGIYPQGKKQIYKVVFSDNNVVECSPDHLWTYQTKNQRDNHRNNFQFSKTKTIKEIYETEDLKKNNGAWNIYIPMPTPIEFEDNNLPLDPYLLGVLLGDGNISNKGIVFTCAEDDLLEKVSNRLLKYNCVLKHIDRYDYSIQGQKGFGYHNVQDYIGATITQLGLRGTNSHTKFIPSIYLYTTVENRLELLRGLIDTDGYCIKSEYEITLASKQLILDIQWLCESLGFTAVYSEKQSYYNGKCRGVVYRLLIKTSEQFIKIHTTQNKDSRWEKGQSSARRTIRQIIPTDQYDEMTCIEIDSTDHLFVIEHGIITHNTKTLIAAISAYRYKYLNDRICAITYTRAARAEMESRLQELGVYDVDVTTIHVWARNRLQELSLLYGFKVNILEETQIKIILRDLVATYCLTSKVKNVNIDILYSYITGSKKMDITENYRRTLNALETRYINYKRDNNLYDFTDYPLYLYNVLQAFDEDIRDVDALFVDEFQDVDEIQLKLFNLVRAKKKFFIGDPWQSIFQFRMADGKVFTKLDDFEIFKLKKNYRSYQEIIDYATTVYLKLQERAELEEDCYISEVMYTSESCIDCDRGYGGQVYVINPYGRNYRNGNCSFALKTPELFNDFMDCNPMILCRTNKQVKIIKNEGYYNVDTVHQAKGLEYKDVIAIDTTINCSEDLNIAYVAMTRAEDKLLVINWQQFEFLFKIYMNKKSFGGFKHE